MKSEMREEFLDKVFTTSRNDKATFITIVGFDGSGKTTQIEAIADAYRKIGREVVVTREPTDWYRQQPLVRNYLDNGGDEYTSKIMTFLIAADRLQHIRDVIQPALDEGKVVICDRYVQATFGIMMHRGVSPKLIMETNEGIPKPDYSFYVSVSVDNLIERLHKRDGDNLKFEERKAERIESIISAYDNMGKYLIAIDGNQSIEKVTEDILSYLPL